MVAEGPATLTWVAPPSAWCRAKSLSAPPGYCGPLSSVRKHRNNSLTGRSGWTGGFVGKLYDVTATTTSKDVWMESYSDFETAVLCGMGTGSWWDRVLVGQQLMSSSPSTATPSHHPANAGEPSPGQSSGGSMNGNGSVSTPSAPGSSPLMSAALWKQAGTPQNSESHQRVAKSFTQHWWGLKPLEWSAALHQPWPPALPKTAWVVNSHLQITWGRVPSAQSKKMLFYNGLLTKSAVTQTAWQAASGTSGGVITVIAEGINLLPIFSWLHQRRRLKRGRVSAKCYGVKPFSI